MTRVTMTANYSNLNNWTGRLFEADAGTVVTVRSATVFSFTLPAGHDFAGFKITAVGTGFTYLGGEPTGGNITQLVVRDAANLVVLVMDTFTNNGIANSLAQFASNAFGWRLNGDGAGPDGSIAWSHLLSGNDIINGTAGDDRELQGVNSGNDIFNMYGGDDFVWGGIGNDTIYGGNGFDTLSYNRTTWNEGASATRGIAANMTTGKLIDSWGNTDTFTGIEHIEGSRFNDVFVGSAARDEFTGLRGADTINGGGEQDRVNYDNDFWLGGRNGIVVDLETSFVGGHYYGTIRDGFGQTDRTIDIERVRGTRYNDVMVGSSDNNAFGGGEGRDYYNGMAGDDSIRFTWRTGDTAQTGIVMNLSLATNQIANDGYGNVETALSIEGVSASQQNDRITMTVGNNWIEGGDGRDTMTGGGGNDNFQWYNPTDIGDTDIITDFSASGAATIDELSFNVASYTNMTTTLRLVNGAAATTAAGVGQFVYNAVNDTLYWDTNGSGAGGMISVVTLTGVNALSAANFDLF